ncbi:MAG: helix-turn-helix transcriptional regulator [Lachnospiraceae bacterium]|nr:helix-turn-helix transcriptional regulator [Lachnospiraceae bacterium]MBD5540265.1 helix-turn-helix transcriptional regulator [Lachnospiraceae bacterium]
MKETYDRLAAGDRIRLKRTLLGLTQEEMAEKINRATKYYADIERGSCGMSIETLMSLSTSLDMSLDYIIYGKTSDEKEEKKNREETTAIIGMLDSSDIRTRQYALNMLKLFFAACKGR